MTSETTALGHSTFLEVCTDFLRSFYTILPKMQSVPGLYVSLIQYGILLIRKHVCGTVPKSGVMGGGISRGEVRQNMEKFPAMAMKVVRVSL